VRPIGGNRESLDVQLHPGVKLIDPAAMQQYAEDLRVVAPQAFPAAVPASEQCHELTVEAR
jgi:hypothetical protein